jgi:cellulose synthase/poly-beta-1,6-N-acetylglucosamine synthase-like glycosyltransferase
MSVFAPEPQPIAASVIIPVFEGADTLGCCLDALQAQTVDADSYEVIVVDDGSTDASALVADRLGAQVICQEHAGPAAARNNGARQARGRYLLFTDADCQPEADWIEQMLIPLSDPGVAGAKGVYRTHQSSLVARFTQAEYEEKYRRLGRAKRIDFVDTYAAAYRRDVFWAHGGFDPEFLLDEDQEFSFRLAGAGRKLVFAPGAVVHHQHPATVWEYAVRKARLAHWKVRVHARHPLRAVRDSYTPWTQKVQIVLAPLALCALTASVLGIMSWAVVAGLALLGWASAIPLTVVAARQGWLVVFVSPLLVLVRSAASVVGLTSGLIHHLGLKAGRIIHKLMEKGRKR